MWSRLWRRGCTVDSTCSCRSGSSTAAWRGGATPTSGRRARGAVGVAPPRPHGAEEPLRQLPVLSAQRIGSGAFADGRVLINGQPEDLSPLVVARHVHVPVEFVVVLGKELNVRQEKLDLLQCDGADPPLPEGLGKRLARRESRQVNGVGHHCARISCKTSGTKPSRATTPPPHTSNRHPPPPPIITAPQLPPHRNAPPPSRPKEVPNLRQTAQRAKADTRREQRLATAVRGRRRDPVDKEEPRWTPRRRRHNGNHGGPQPRGITFQTSSRGRDGHSRPETGSHRRTQPRASVGQ